MAFQSGFFPFSLQLHRCNITSISKWQRPIPLTALLLMFTASSQNLHCVWIPQLCRLIQTVLHPNVHTFMRSIFIQSEFEDIFLVTNWRSQVNLSCFPGRYQYPWILITYSISSKVCTLYTLQDSGEQRNTGRVILPPSLPSFCAFYFHTRKFHTNVSNSLQAVSLNLLIFLLAGYQFRDDIQWIHTKSL